MSMETTEMILGPMPPVLFCFFIADNVTECGFTGVIIQPKARMRCAYSVNTVHI